MKNKVILLVEDNPDDVKLTMRALKKSNVLNEVVVAQDGAEALDYLFCTGKYSGRDGRTRGPNSFQWSSLRRRAKIKTALPAISSTLTATSANRWILTSSPKR
jgi:hypothetical protein